MFAIPHKEDEIMVCGYVTGSPHLIQIFKFNRDNTLYESVLAINGCFTQSFAAVAFSEKKFLTVSSVQ